MATAIVTVLVVMEVIAAENSRKAWRALQGHNIVRAALSST